MPPYIRITAVISVALALAGCEQSGSADVDRAIGDLNVIDENNLNDIMLSAADPAEAVTYFRSAAAENPDRIDLQRGLATSLSRARMHTEGAAAWARVVASDEVTDQDRVVYADALIRAQHITADRLTVNQTPDRLQGLHGGYWRIEVRGEPHPVLLSPTRGADVFCPLRPNKNVPVPVTPVPGMSSEETRSNP